MANTVAASAQRLPSFGAEAAVGPPSRTYRSPLMFGTTGAAAVAPSYMDDAGDADSDDGDDSDDAGADDAEEGVDGVDSNTEDADGADDESDDSQSET